MLLLGHEQAVPGCEADSTKGRGDWLSSCCAIPSLFFTKARICIVTPR